MLDLGIMIAQVEAYENHLSLATAIAVGLLVGLEREQTKPQRRGAALAGVRTYPLFALVGALATLLEPASTWLPLGALLGVFALVGISYAADVRALDDTTDRGVTTEISVIATYLIGALATSKGVIEPMADRLVLVAGIGVVIAFLLSAKQRFHSFAARVSRDDLFATITFLILVVIVLPLLPDLDLGPFDAINARTVGLLVVTISGLSFLGYVGTRLWGTRRGLVIGAALGGLVSSTAVTLSFANRTRHNPALAGPAAAAIAIAWSVMIARVAVLVAIVAPALLATLWLPLVAMGATMLAGLALTLRRGAGGDGGELSTTLTNPFELGSAIKVSLVFAAVLIATKAAIAWFGDRGLYIAAALAGTTDVDAVTLSSARVASGLPATAAIAIAIGVNTAVKVGLAAGIGGRALGGRLALIGVMVVITGGIAVAISAALA
jgi:uncharacterized membrane protein (DUF4010 family)